MTDPTDHDELRTLADKLDDIAQRAEEEHISGVRPALRKWDTDRLHAAADVLRDDLQRRQRAYLATKRLTAERDAERAGRERAEADRDRFREHSILLNRVCWKLLEATGRVGPDDDRYEHHSDEECLEMVAELVERLDDAQLRSIEARNPGIDMEEVRRMRSCECVHRSVQHDHIGCAVIGCDCPATNPRSTDE